MWLKAIARSRFDVGCCHFHGEDGEGHEGEGAADEGHEGKGTDEGHEGDEGAEVEVEVEVEGGEGFFRPPRVREDGDGLHESGYRGVRPVPRHGGIEGHHKVGSPPIVAWPRSRVDGCTTPKK